MSDNKKLDGLLDYLKKNNISTKDAEVLIKGHNGEEARKQREKDMATFKKGLWLRNTFALIVLIMLFLAFLQQTNLP